MQARQTRPDGWFIGVDGSSHGPFPFATLRQAALEGKLGRETLVWCPGMPDWIAAGIVEGLFQPPALPHSAINSEPSSQPLRTDLDEELAIGPDEPLSRAVAPQRPGAWRRFFARWIDFWLSALPTVSLAGFTLGFLSPQFGSWIQHSTNILFLLIALPFAFAADACVVRIFGNSLGKALLGLRVCNTVGEPLVFLDYLKRNFSVRWYGYGAGIPPFSIFMMIYQARSILKNGGAVYDIGRFRVEGKKLPLLRCVIAGLLVVAILVGVAGVNMAGGSRAR